MTHDWTVLEDSDGRWVGTCSCGYGAIGGYESDVIDNISTHAEV